MPYFCLSQWKKLVHYNPYSQRHSAIFFLFLTGRYICFSEQSLVCSHMFYTRLLTVLDSTVEKTLTSLT